MRRTREGYDAIAPQYAAHFREEFARKSLGRAMLGAFAERAADLGAGPVADIGCGPGWVTDLLHGLGVDACGIDMSPGMLAVARASYPELTFTEGSMTALDLADGSLGGIVAWYSVIHVPPALLPRVFAEFHRALAPGAPLLLAFQVGDDPLRLTEAFGHDVDMLFRRLTPERVTDLLRGAGLTYEAQLVREPYEGERTAQAYVLARK
ncbi:class I SAM-dependent methyltransferase [Streptomyces sp. SID14478]|nr:class I SAM-dependent methyltransferase [Streptomyces sp. SID14478]NEB82512.1 class I SAM-dependent methyltransferase [Streptomyces sp. SID14478]